MTGLVEYPKKNRLSKKRLQSMCAGSSRGTAYHGSRPLSDGTAGHRTPRFVDCRLPHLMYPIAPEWLRVFNSDNDLLQQNRNVFDWGHNAKPAHSFVDFTTGTKYSCSIER